MAVAIRDWIVERLQDYHANLGTDTRLMEARDSALACCLLWEVAGSDLSGPYAACHRIVA